MINSENMEELFKMWRIYLMAEGGDEETLQIYLYSKHQSGAVVCFELVVDKGEHSLVVNVKSQSEGLGRLYCQYVEEFLTLNDIIQ